MSYKVIFDPFSGALDYVPVPTSIIQSNESANVVLASIPCDSSVQAGDIVIMDNGIAIKASAASFATSNAIGIVDAKDSSTTCEIRTSGLTNDLYSNLDPTLDYFLSDTVPGQLTSVAPTASGTVILRMGQAFDSTSFLVNKSNRVLRS